MAALILSALTFYISILNAAGLANPAGALAVDAGTISSAAGDVILSGVGGVTLDTVDQHDVVTTVTQTHTSGFLGLSSTTTHSNDVLTTDTAIGALVSGNNVSILGGAGAINVIGSTVAGNAGVTLAAQGPINILDAANTSVENYSYSSKTSGLSFGLGGGGIGISIGTSSLNQNQNTDIAASSGSLVGATAGPTTLASAGAVTVRGSQLVAGAGNLNVSGTSLTVENGVQTLNQSETTTQSSSGFFIGITGGLVSEAVAAGTAVSALTSDAASGNGAATALQALAGARDLYNLENGIAGAVKSPTTAFDNVSLVLGFGASSSQSRSATASLEGVGSTLNASGNVNLAATGGAGAGALAVTGSSISGTNVTAAADTIALNAAANTLATTNSSSSDSGFFGVTLGTQGIGVTGNLSQSQGNGSTSQLTHTNSVVDAANTASLTSTGLTSLNGGQVQANQIIANLGALTIGSLQDTASQTQQSSSFSAGLTIGPLSNLSFGAANSNANGAYQSVTSPSGLFAGNGGFQVNVAGATTLNGGYVTSSQAAANDNLNSLTTGSLAVTSIANSSSYSVASSGFGFSTGGFIPVTAFGLSQSGAASSVTAGGVTQNASAPTITVANPADQATAAALAAQSAGLTSANVTTQAGVLAANPNVAAIAGGQQQTVAAAQAAESAVAETAADPATGKAINSVVSAIGNALGGGAPTTTLDELVVVARTSAPASAAAYPITDGAANINGVAVSTAGLPTSVADATSAVAATGTAAINAWVPLQLAPNGQGGYSTTTTDPVYDAANGVQTGTTQDTTTADSPVVYRQTVVNATTGAQAYIYYDPANPTQVASIQNTVGNTASSGALSIVSSPETPLPDPATEIANETQAALAAGNSALCPNSACQFQVYAQGYAAASAESAKELGALVVGTAGSGVAAGCVIVTLGACGGLITEGATAVGATLASNTPATTAFVNGVVESSTPGTVAFATATAGGAVVTAASQNTNVSPTVAAAASAVAAVLSDNPKAAGQSAVEAIESLAETDETPPPSAPSVIAANGETATPQPGTTASAGPGITSGPGQATTPTISSQAAAMGASDTGVAAIVTPEATPPVGATAPPVASVDAAEPTTAPEQASETTTSNTPVAQGTSTPVTSASQTSSGSSAATPAPAAASVPTGAAPSVSATAPPTTPLPSGYDYASSPAFGPGTVIGPNGGIYVPTGATDATSGLPVYAQPSPGGSISYYTLDAGGGRVPVDAPPSGTLSQVQINYATHLAAVNDLTYQLNALPNVTVTTNIYVTTPTAPGNAVADGVISGAPGGVVTVPDNYVATLLGGDGQPVANIQLNADGQAFFDMKTGEGDLTPNQTIVYPQVQTGAATSYGTNAITADVPENVPPTPVYIIRPKP